MGNKWLSSAIGLGVESLGRAVQDDLTSIVRFAIDSGVNYIDLGAAGMVDERASRRLLVRLGRALRDGYRWKVRIAATLPWRRLGSAIESARYVERVREWVGEGPIDFLMFGGLDRGNWPRLAKLDILPWAEEEASETKPLDRAIGHIGFSFNDDYQTLRTVLDGSDGWKVARFRYSFMDVDHHPGVGDLGLAASRGLAVVVSEPLLRGRLIRNIPEPVARVWTKRRRPAHWALRWVLAHREVSTVVVDPATAAEVVEYVAIANTTRPGSLSLADEILVSRVRDEYRKLKPVPCTACRSCLPCPIGIDVPLIFELYNEAVMYRDVTAPRAAYPEERHRAEACDRCGACAARCGMGIAIPDRLAEALRKLR